MTLRVICETRTWPMREPFAIARGVQTEMPTLQVRLEKDGRSVGRGEACGVDYLGETVASMTEQVMSIRGLIEQQPSRDLLIEALPPGGARFALDSALWDYEAKQTGRSVYDLVGIADPAAIRTAYTIGIRPLHAYEAAARERASFRILKVKVNSEDPVAAIKAVKRGAPNSRLIVDPNQAWSSTKLKEIAHDLVPLDVILLEQPIAVGSEHELEGYTSPIALCADELVNDAGDLERATAFDVINIKLDKAGGLTAAMRLAAEAQRIGKRTMVGCMGGSSLSIAPALVLAQTCAFADLDGPLLQAEDCVPGLIYSGDMIGLPDATFWG